MIGKKHGILEENWHPRLCRVCRGKKRSYISVVGKLDLPGVTKECFLEALKYLKTSKQHPFETPG